MELIKEKLIITNYNTDNSSNYEIESLVLDEYVCDVCGQRYELCTCTKK